MIQDYDGAQVIDADGDKIGTVERSYVDDRGDVRFVEVKMGSLRAKHRMIPMDDADQTAAGLRVPYPKQVIEGSPDVSSLGDNLTGDTLQRVRSYYTGNTRGVSAGDQTAAAVPAQRGDTEVKEGIGDKVRERFHEVGEKVGGALHQHSHDEDAGSATDTATSSAVDSEGDVVQIPVVEEQLVKQPVITEVLHVRRTPETERSPVAADIPKDDVDVVQDGETVIRRNEDGGTQRNQHR